MIRCKQCGRFAKPGSIKYNKFTEDVKDFEVQCSRCGITEGDYTDWEEINSIFNLEANQ